MHTTAESLFDLATNGARRVGNGFTHPEDDWAPVLFARSNNQVLVLALPPGPDKDLTAALIAGYLQHVNATEAATVQSAWSLKTANIGPGSPSIDVPPSQHPDRQEVVIVVHVDRDQTTIGMAPILRSPTAPPTLGDFDTTANGLGLTGRFADALRVGIG